MTKEEYTIWLKEHNNKVTISQLREIGLIEKTVGDGTYWMDENGVTLMIAFNMADADINKEFVVKAIDPIVPPQVPSIDKLVKNMEKYLSSDYETPISMKDLDKKFYDKFYERKGRKYSRVR